jgi:hypothetical protein
MALNPIWFAGQVNEQFRRYQLTAFPIADPDLAAQARLLLGTGAFGTSPLVKGPYLSVARAFELADSLADLATAGRIHPALAGIAEHPVLFRHQQDTLEAVQSGRHVLLSTGTGSGKTESFFYPIIDHCLKLRDDPTSLAGVTAVLVYPMNALAADQRDRLRGLLAGTGITFGLYVGSTPRRRADANVVQLAQGIGRDGYELERSRRLQEGVAVTPWEECISEDDIVERRPRMLLTNANQLEILLTRGRDLGLFADAPLRFLVLDEAHTYGGATGAEVACLMRRLRAFCGKTVDEVTCVATSATIVDPEHSTEVGPAFLSRLFGVPEDLVQLVSERYVAPTRPGRRIIPAPPADPAAILDDILAALGTGVDDVDEPGLISAVERLTGQAPSGVGSLSEVLYEELAANELSWVLSEELVHPHHLDDAVAKVWRRLARHGAPGPNAGLEVLAYLALGPYAEADGAPLLRPKMHIFVRGLEGAAVVMDGAPVTPRLYGSAETALDAAPDRVPGAVFPLWVCRTCGQHYFEAWLNDFGLDNGRPVGGDAIGEAAVWTPVGEEAGARVRFTNRFLAEEGDDGDDDTSSAATRRLDARRVAMHVCRWCGAFHASPGVGCNNPACQRVDPLAPVFVVVEGAGFRCPGCGATSTRIGGRRVEPIRPLRAVTVSDVHILAQEMINAAPTDAERHLLVFADNRQDAAFQAGWMRDHARRYRLRHLMLQAVTEGTGPVSIGDIHATLNRRLQADRELARALAPEAFSSEADEAFGNVQRHNLARFLRIQILRELTTAMNQRESLERWGQVRVIYAGIDADDPEVQQLADDLGMSPGDLADGAAALLDTWRRARLFSDPDELMFGRYWKSGDEEILRGFIPAGFADLPPRGLKLERETGDKDTYVQQLVSSRGRTAAVDFVSRWGLADPRAAVEAIWQLLTTKGLVGLVTLTGSNGGPLSGAAGVRQVAGPQLGLVRQHERWRCTTCQRVHARPTPGSVCTKRFCQGTLIREEPPTDDYNVALLERPFSMVLAEEHTAQVPPKVREEIEREFKRTNGRVNTLVATPTLELGVDIGALDLVLLRNVPPTPTNYWQRVGRAGRRRRMAVLYSYCRRAIHDTYFFQDPDRLLGAAVRPPRFNLKNDVLVAKHVRSTVLSELLRLRASERLDAADTAALDRAFPTFVRDYVFEGPRRYYRSRPSDVLGLGRVIADHRAHLVAAAEQVFARGWPEEAGPEAAPERLEKLVDSMAGDLQEVVNRLHERMMWTVRTRQRLNQEANLRQLEPEEEGQLARCKDFLRRLADERPDTYTLTVLATFGFLPGYGIYEGGVTAFPSSTGPREFELSRPAAIAVREFVPGNLLYANRRRFRAARYHFPISEDQALTERYVVEPAEGRIRFASSVAAGYAAADALSFEALPISDADLAQLGPIRDDETERFQLPVVVLGMPRGERRGGAAYTSGGRMIQLLFGEGLRLVNVGPASRVRDGELGYPVCRVCGAARSPYSSQAELDNFAQRHTERCGRPPARVGFTADATVDALHFLGLAAQGDAANLGEALRTGASQVLEMESDDLQILVLPDADGGWSLYLYDPMPGGSGLLGQIVERWPEIVDVLRTLLGSCSNACEASCYQCLRTGRNVFWHRVLDRHAALELIEVYADIPAFDYVIPPQAGPAGQGPFGTHGPEDRLAGLLERAAFGGFIGQSPVEIGPPYGSTTPDFVHESEDAPVAVYLDGLSEGLHGDPNRARRDAIIRGQLEDRGWNVVVIAASHLDDPELLVLDFKKIARALGGTDLARQIDEDRRWLDEPEFTAVPDEATGSILDLVSDAARSLIEEAISLAAPIPEIGYEVGDGWPVEAAWVQAKVAVVVDGLAERDQWLVDNGWDARRPSDWPATELAKSTTPTAS